MRTYRIIRTVEEVFEVEARTKKEASAKLNDGGNMISTRVVRERIIWVDRPISLPPGYIALSLAFKNPNE